MKILPVLVVFVLVNGALLLGPGDSSALVLSLDTIFSGSTTATAPFATIDITAISGGVQFMITNLTPGMQQGGSSKLDSIYLNYMGSQTLTLQPPPSNTTLQYQSNAFKADGDGYFDILFEYQTNHYLGTNDSVTFTILGDANPLNFVDLSVPGGGDGVFTSAAHMMAVIPDGNSFWAGSTETPTHPIPEPATWLLLSSGLTLFGFRRRIV